MRRRCGLALIVALVVAADARAQTQTPQRTKVTVFLVPARGYRPQLLARLSNAFAAALKRNVNLQMEDSDKMLAELAGEVPSAEISDARATLARGLEQLKAGAPAEAVAPLQLAHETFERVLAFVKKQDLAQAGMALAVAQAEAGQPRPALETFVRLLTWRPHLRYDTSTFDGRHIPLFEKAREIVKKKKRGSVELTTTPDGAKAYVDGKYFGVTPTVVFGLKVGEHYATYKKSGCIKATQRITVSPTAQERYQLELKRSEKFLLIRQALADAQRGLGKTQATTGMGELRTLLLLDQVVFATVGYAGPSQLHLQAYLYDLRSRLRLNQAALTVDQQTMAGVDRLTELLYHNVRYDGSLEAPPEPPPPPPKKRTPLYAAWWFWTAIAAGVATAVVVPVLVWPESNTCDLPCATIRND